MAIGNRKNVNQNPLMHAGWVSKTFFWWLKDLIRRGRKENLVADDLYDPIPEDRSDALRSSLEIGWNREINDAQKMNRKPRLWKAVAKTYCWNYFKLSVFPVIFSFLLTVGPCLLELMMSYFGPESKLTDKQVYLSGSVFVILMILRTVFFQHSFFHLYRLGMRASIACTSLIYKKMLRLSASTSQSSRSSIINLLTADVAKFEVFFIFSPFVFIVPIQLLVTTFFIWNKVGLDATLASVALMIFLTLPILVFYDKIFFKLRKKQNVKTDERLSLIGEIISGVRAVKMYVWENYFERRVYLARRLEIKSYLNISYVASIVGAISCFCHRLCIFVVVLIRVSKCGMISVNEILPVSQHFNNLQLSITMLVFSGIRRIADMRVSMKRIEEFLLLPEVNSEATNIFDGSTDEIISIENVTASWDDQSNVLENVSLHFLSEKLYAVVGALGSGKSSLLKLMLQEIRLKSGIMYVNGKLSYASQGPWLFPGSVKENILFGEIYDEERYSDVIAACELLEDFSHLPYGDETLVGDRGMNLSGGQCARVNLARAVYREADIYLFDNALAAVDTRVAQKLMSNCINGFLQDKTRILVTHNMGLLKDNDDLIFLKCGMVEFNGSVENFRNNYQCFENVISDQTENLGSGPQTFSDYKTNVLINASYKNKEPKESEELIAKGLIKMSVYSRYIKAGGLHHVILLILLNIAFVTSVVIFDYGLVAWLQDESSSSRNRIYLNEKLFSLNVTEEFETVYQTNVSPLLGRSILLMVFISTLTNIVFNRMVLYASANIHNSMISQLMKTTLRFFEVNPSGQILNRFSEDTRMADDTLPQVLSEAIQSTFLATAVLLSAAIVNWWIIIPSGMSIFLYILIGRMYLGTIPKLTRLVGVAKSPVLSYTSSSLAGLTTIRASKAENMVSREFNARLDRYTAVNFVTAALLQGSSLWVGLSNLGFLASTIFICIIWKNKNTSDGNIGLVLMQVMNTTIIVWNMFLRLVQALSFMPNVERMLQFADLEPEESDEKVSHVEVPYSWPDKGEIKFEKLYLRYSNDTDPVLWNLNITIESGSKVGIVGRTGAGKSSLISALFRLAKIDGSLIVDGVDINKVELLKLRSKISIIPQEPFLFKATLRKNLDPLTEFEDALLWSALEDVELKGSFITLDYPIESGGSNLSLGQRQLLCLARAILKKSKILILDEATANIDLATDALIQKTIRSKFKECTVLTIAHRLETVMDNNKILVMDSGRVVEYDHPFLLLQNNDSFFSNMVQQTDDATVNKLKAIAQQAYVKPETIKKSN